MADLVVREYGSGTVSVIALHGGPAAVGDVAPLASELGERWHVLEPFQRGSGDQPISVATHVQDLDELIRERCADGGPVLVGHSWGAMLALAYAATHPTVPAALVLIGCGTFSKDARVEFEARLSAKLTPTDHANIAKAEQIEMADRRLAAVGRLMTRVYGHDIEEVQAATDSFDSRAHKETWADMVRLQEDGVYPAAFAAIRMPVLMLHGEADPHPGLLTSQDLRAYIPHLEYCELAACGHSPWLERLARQAFFAMLETWLGKQLQPLTAQQAGC